MALLLGVPYMPCAHMAGDGAAFAQAITAAGRTQPRRYSESVPRLHWHARCANRRAVFPIAGVVPISYTAAAVMPLSPGDRIVFAGAPTPTLCRCFFWPQIGLNHVPTRGRCPPRFPLLLRIVCGMDAV